MGCKRVTGVVLCSAFLLSIPALTHAETAKIRVALMDFQAKSKDISKNTTSLLSELLMTEIQNLGNVHVIGKDDIQAMFGFEKQKEVMGCEETSCLAEIGGALGVDKIVTGNLGLMGSYLIIAAKLINIEAVTVENRVTRKIQGGNVDTIVEVVGPLVKELFSATGIGHGKIVEGFLKVTCNKDGAAVSIDGASVGVTPLDSLKLKEGKHRLVATLDGYEKVERNIEVAAGDVSRIDLVLIPAAGSLVFSADQAGVKVLVDRVDVGVTPLEKPVRVAAGKHMLTAQLAGHKVIRREFSVQPGEERKIAVTMEPAEGTLDVRTGALPGQVYVDAKFIGTTPLKESITLPVGEHDVVVEGPAGDRWENKVTIQEGEIERLEVTLKAPSAKPPATAAAGAAASPAATPVAEPGATTERRVEGDGAAEGGGGQVWSWVTLGVAAACIATGGAMLGVGAYHLQEAGNLVDKSKSEQIEYGSFKDKYDTGSSEWVAGFALVGAGAAVAIVSIILFVYEGDDGPDKAGASLDVAPDLVAGGGALMLGGKF